MRITDLHVENFKSLALLDLSNLGDFVLIAGPNGVGKSCVLDAIRILKSHHGGYFPNEIDHLYSEFQLEATDPRRLASWFGDTNKPLSIAAKFTISEAEREYVNENAKEILTEYVWRTKIGRQSGDNMQMYQQRMFVAASNPDLVRQVDVEVAEKVLEIQTALEENKWGASLTISFGSMPVSEGDLFLRVVFGHYAPQELGVIDYHSAHRVYNREVVSGLNVNFMTTPLASGEQSLYNTSGKYQGIKSAMVEAYLKSLIRSDVQRRNGDANDATEEYASELESSLQELFSSFFPNKSFDGLQMSSDGVPEFPVTVAGGSHDLNELSSGEKEILLGYLRLRTATPRNSIILLDEPELHLNPALLARLPQFYRTNIGQARSNQLILVTHSDAILRPVLGNDQYTLVHLSAPTGSGPLRNQASILKAQDEFERALISLTGDVASYKPNAKYLLVEGGDNTSIASTGFDRTMISTLFPDFAQRVNILGSGDRAKVERLFDLLEDEALHAEFGHRIFAIVDRDSFDLTEQATLSLNYAQWDSYHIENYLLDETSISRVVSGLKLVDFSPQMVKEGLIDAARSIIGSLTYRRIRNELNKEIVSSIHLGRNAGKENPAELLHKTMSASLDRVTKAVESMDKSALEKRLNSVNDEHEVAIADGTWRILFPGRDVLKVFSKVVFNGSLSYENLRNAIITDMATHSVQPEGMKVRLMAVDADTFG